MTFNIYICHIFISVFVFLHKKNRYSSQQQVFLYVDVLDPVYADSLPSKPAFCCLNEVLDTLHSNSVPYHKNTCVMLNRLHR